MRQDRRCPKCEGRAFYVVERARMSDGQSVERTISLALAAAYVPAKGWAETTMVLREAHVDAWICASCGFAELYARDLEALEVLRARGTEGVSFVDATPGSEGAFR